MLFSPIFALSRAAQDAPNAEDAGASDRSPSVFVASTPDPARDGHVIDQGSWRLDEYRANPVVLYAHEDDCLPVGRGIVTLEGGVLMVSVEWDWSDPKAVEIARKVKAGFLNAVSVRWIPGEAIPRWRLPREDTLFSEDGGYIFRHCVLLEISVVAVPADPRALVVQRSAARAEERALSSLIRAEGERAVAAALPAIREEIRAEVARALADAAARGAGAPPGWDPRSRWGASEEDWFADLPAGEVDGDWFANLP